PASRQTARMLRFILSLPRATRSGRAPEQALPQAGGAGRGGLAAGRHGVGRQVSQYTERPGLDQMGRLGCSDPARRGLAALGEQRWTALGVVGVGREDVDAALVEHALAPVARGL